MNPVEIIIKDPDILIGLMERNYSPLLIRIIADVAKEHGLVMTESYREKRHRNDLHGTQPVRAIDLRTWCYPDGLAYRIMDEINNRWEYDPIRPEKQVAIIHDVGQGMHFHIQVHPHTKRRSMCGN